MPRKVLLTEAKLQWLAESFGQHPMAHLAKELGCCVDTLNRTLVRQGLARFDGVKFALRREHDTKYWQRPCMRCKCTIPRSALAGAAASD